LNQFFQGMKKAIHLTGLVTLVTLVACSSPQSASTGSPAPPPISATATATTAAAPTSTPGALLTGKDYFGSEQMRARAGQLEVEAKTNNDGSYQLLYKTWFDQGGGAESASGIPFSTGDPKAAEALKVFLAANPGFRSLGLTVTEALAAGEHAPWKLRPEDQENAGKMLAVLKDG
jgi:hypothetical protein